MKAAEESTLRADLEKLMAELRNDPIYQRGSLRCDYMMHRLESLLASGYEPETP